MFPKAVFLGAHARSHLHTENISGINEFVWNDGSGLSYSQYDGIPPELWSDCLMLKGDDMDALPEDASERWVARPCVDRHNLSAVICHLNLA